jgi:alkylation response protein AidB-like acyl-CoA dehydrogenase
MTCFICEKEPGASENPGLTVPPKIKKMGYKGVESTELVFDGYRCPADMVLGGEEAGLGKGFVQMMDALEVGRVNVAARGVGIAQRALELALRYSQERKTFGKTISNHQAIQFKLADMATQIEAARLVTRKAARMKDAGERSDLEAGMAKLIASETGKFCVEESFRIHGGYGYSKEYEIERLYRRASSKARWAMPTPRAATLTRPTSSASIIWMKPWPTPASSPPRIRSGGHL